ncbi:MAG: 7TM diverse intracellular signaling domain-containing protein [Cytophagaceae bacterium]
MSVRIILAIAFQWLLFTGINAYAFVPLKLIKNDTLYRVTNKILFHQDKSEHLTLNDIINNRSLFNSVDDSIPTFRPTTFPIWGYFKIVNHSSQSDWYIEIEYHNDEVDLYLVDSSGGVQQFDAGISGYFKSRFVESNRIIIPIKLPFGSTDCFLKIKSRKGIRVPVVISSLKTIYEANHKDDLINCIYYGLILTFTLINAFVFFSIRDKVYLFYVLYIVFFFFLVAHIQGYVYEFLGVDFFFYTGGLGILFATFFSVSFLNLKKYSPFLYHLRWIPIGLLIVAFIFLLTNNHIYAGKAIFLNPFLIYGIIIGIVVYKKGFKPAKIYIIGFTIVIISVLVVVLSGYDILNYNIRTDRILQFGSTVEAITLSYALSVRFKIFKKERNQIHKASINQSVSFSRILIQSQETEKKRIAAELHDSLGQKLVIIKNRVDFYKIQYKDRFSQLNILNEVGKSVSKVIQKVREISYRLRPFQIDYLGLSKSIEMMVDESDFQFDIKIRSHIQNIDDFISKEDYILFYRIIQDILCSVFTEKTVRYLELHVGVTEKHVVVKIVHDAFNIIDYEYCYKKGLDYNFLKRRIEVLNGEIVINTVENKMRIISVSIPAYQKQSYS